MNLRRNLKVMHKQIISIFALFLVTSCSSTSDILQTASDLLSGNSGKPTQSEVSGGLKQALQIGIDHGADQVSRPDGFFKNLAIKILFPPEAKKVETALRNIGLGSICDNVIKSFNRAAEKAAKEAKPIFVNAIKQLTFKDVMDILFGADNAATQYLKRTTSPQLKLKFKPVISNSMDKVNATKYWGEVTSRYNNIPFVQPVETDISAYVTDKALDGLFHVIEKEEKKIRKDPLQRTTALLKKVFGYADKNDN